MIVETLPMVRSSLQCVLPVWPEDREVASEHVPLDPDPVPAPLHLPQPVPGVPGSVLGQGVCNCVTKLTPCWEQEGSMQLMLAKP